ncbi:hypothetical protein [Nocardia ninae]|nr:hypothetical protein [Nocardia ninae]
MRRSSPSNTAPKPQLGHANDSVTKRHYIDQPTEASDFTAALGGLAR